jgi:hypothetical protein
MRSVNVSNMVLNIQTSNVGMVVGHYAMVRRTYTSITFANIFGMRS